MTIHSIITNFEPIDISYPTAVWDSNVYLPNLTTVTSYQYAIANSPTRVIAAVQPYLGYIDELMISSGYALYTSNFTPPALPYS